MTGDPVRHETRFPIVAYIDHVGCMRCVRCAGERPTGFPVYGDSKPHCDELCDMCRKPVKPREDHR